MNNIKEITEEEKQAIIDKIARKVVSMKLAPLAIVLLESSKPLSFIGSQLLVFFRPFIQTLFPISQYETVISLLEDRKNIEKLITEIERLEGDKNETTDGADIK